ncbi:hypothetical protein SRB17_45250 [Streptomyces sp. RB17]|nr:hypothetical protein [Streptomyces sp. RB17]
MTGGEENRDSELIREWFDATGAVVMGRMMYGTGEEFWGADPPFRTPVFVLTHRPRPTLVKEGGTTFTFVTDGIHGALDRAKAAAGDRNVDITGGASTVQQYLRAGLVEKLQLHVVLAPGASTAGAVSASAPRSPRRAPRPRRPSRWSRRRRSHGTRRC